MQSGRLSQGGEDLDCSDQRSHRGCKLCSLTELSRTQAVVLWIERSFLAQAGPVSCGSALQGIVG
jgi:hypothetical protein